MAIELLAVGYRYAGASRATLRSINLRLEPGRVLGVAGANESGKTTLCLAASGFAPGVVGGHLDQCLSTCPAADHMQEDIDPAEFGEDCRGGGFCPSKIEQIQG